MLPAFHSQYSNGASHHSHYSNGASFFNGNGFIPLSQPPASSLTPNAADLSSRVKKRTPKTGVLPLTVKQASQALQHPFDDTFTMYGADVNLVTIVGMVVDKVENTSDVSFALYDGTGRVDVKCWVDGLEIHACKEILTVQNGGYVRIYGHLRVFQGKRSIVALSIRSIVDFNEVVFHFLESVYVCVFNVNCRGQVEPSNLLGGFATSFMQRPTVAPFYNGHVGAVGPTQGSFAQYTTSYPGNTGGCTDACAKRVQSIFEEPHNLTLEAGLHVDDVVRRMNGYGRQQVREAIEFLVNEGMIYSTIDDDHYRSTNG